LPEGAAVKEYLTTAVDGKSYATKHYSLDMIIAVGYRVRSARGTQFRQWATATLAEYLTKGFAIDDARLKAGKNWGADYFDELLARIRDIRASERRSQVSVAELHWRGRIVSRGAASVGPPGRSSTLEAWMVVRSPGFKAGPRRHEA